MAMHLANAISYITDEVKMQDGILAGSHNCNVEFRITGDACNKTERWISGRTTTLSYLSRNRK